MTTGIRYKVGRGGMNQREDVVTVQSLLNKHNSRLAPLALLKVDGLVGNKTISAIEKFQKVVLNFYNCDGRVDPGGKTITAPLAGGPGVPVTTPGTTPGVPAAPKANVGNLQIKVERFQSSNQSTIGKLYLNSKFICYSLEEAWRDNARSVSCVPAGTYNAYIRYTSNKSKREWCFELTDVPNRTAIQFHIGNDAGDTEGCILVGTTYSTDHVGNSTAAYQLLQDAVFGPGFTRQQIREAKPVHGKITAEFTNP